MSKKTPLIGESDPLAFLFPHNPTPLMAQILKLSKTGNAYFQNSNPDTIFVTFLHRFPDLAMLLCDDFAPYAKVVFCNQNMDFYEAENQWFRAVDAFALHKGIDKTIQNQLILV